MQKTIGINLLCCVWLFLAVAHAETTLWQGGEVQLEVASLYARGRARTVDVALPPLRADFGAALATLRWGASDRVQMAVIVQYLVRTATWAEESTSGLGNLEATLAVRLWGDGLEKPAVVGTVGTRFPTAGDTFGAVWEPRGALTVFHQRLPFVFLGQLGFAYPLETTFQHVRIAPGSIGWAHGGIGVRLDDAILLWLRTDTTYQGTTHRAGRTLPGSDRLESSLQVALTWAFHESFAVEVSVAPGLTHDTPDVVLGLSLTYTLARSSAKGGK